MTIQQLKCAVEVWKCGSINKAAERLYMNQPNISRLIKNLESEFGLTLFSRTSSGMVATRDGELFLMQAEKLVKNTDTFEQRGDLHVIPHRFTPRQLPDQSLRPDVERGH